MQMNRDSHVHRNQRKCVQVQAVNSTAENQGIHKITKSFAFLYFKEKKVKFVSMHTHYMDTES